MLRLITEDLELLTMVMTVLYVTVPFPSLILLALGAQRAPSVHVHRHVTTGALVLHLGCLVSNRRYNGGAVAGQAAAGACDVCNTPHICAQFLNINPLPSMRLRVGPRAIGFNVRA